MCSKEPVLELFNLPPNETIFQDFVCAFQKTFLQYGRLFVSENYLCFYANVLGSKTKVLDFWQLEFTIRFDVIESITKETVYGYMQNAIKVTDREGKSYKFCSFSQRDQAYSLINAVWKCEPINFTPEDPQQPAMVGEQEVEDGEVEVSFLGQETAIFDLNLPLMSSNLPISVDRFFEYFFSDQAIYSVRDFHSARGDWEIELSPWANEEHGSTRELKCMIKLVNVPFQDRSRLYKVQTHIKNAETGVLTINMMTKTPDVPFGSFFQTEEKWIIEPAGGDKCMMKCYCSMVFLKPFYLKKTIESRAKQAMQRDYENWIAKVKRTLEEKRVPKREEGSLNDADYEQSTEVDGYHPREPRIVQTPQKAVQNNTDAYERLHRLTIVNSFFLLLLILILMLVLLHMHASQVTNERLLNRIMQQRVIEDI